MLAPQKTRKVGVTDRGRPFTHRGDRAALPERKPAHCPAQVASCPRLSSSSARQRPVWPVGLLAWAARWRAPAVPARLHADKTPARSRRWLSRSRTARHSASGSEDRVGLGGRRVEGEEQPRERWPCGEMLGEQAVERALGTRPRRAAEVRNLNTGQVFLGRVSWLHASANQMGAAVGRRAAQI